MNGAVLFCGTIYAPPDDLDAPGKGFTHHLGDRVTVSNERLADQPGASEHAVRAVGLRDRRLMRNFAKRGAL